MKLRILVFLLCSALNVNIYANPDAVPVTYYSNIKLSQKEIINIFLGRQNRWPDGKPIKVFILPLDHPLHVEFCKNVLGVFPYQFDNIWLRATYSGIGTAPDQVESIEEMQAQLKTISNSIGYLDM